MVTWLSNHGVAGCRGKRNVKEGSVTHRAELYP